jgi:hypothetical protein
LSGRQGAREVFGGGVAEFPAARQDKGGGDFREDAAMPRDADDFERRLLLDEFRSMLAEMDRLGIEAPDGAVLDDLETVIETRGRALLRTALQAQAQAAIEAAEKKGRPPARTAKPRPATRAPARAR